MYIYIHVNVCVHKGAYINAHTIYACVRTIYIYMYIQTQKHPHTHTWLYYLALLLALACRLLGIGVRKSAAHKNESCHISMRQVTCE